MIIGVENCLDYGYKMNMAVSFGKKDLCLPRKYAIVFKTPVETSAFYLAYIYYALKAKKIKRSDKEGLEKIYKEQESLQNFLKRRLKYSKHSDGSNSVLYVSKHRDKDFELTDYVPIEIIRKTLANIKNDYEDFLKKYKRKQKWQDLADKCKDFITEKQVIWSQDKMIKQAEKEQKRQEVEKYKNRFEL